MAAPEEIENQSNTRAIDSKYKFEAGEKVLCYHGPLIYESKCQRVRMCEEDNTPEYLIHYCGWNKSYDEWVEESRILKYNDINVKKQQELERAQPKGKERRKVRRRGTSTETKQSVLKELKSSDSSSQAPGSSNPIKGEISQPIVIEEISQAIVKPEQNTTDDEPTPENQIELESRDGRTEKINDENSCVSNLITIIIKEEFDADNDQSCSVDIKVEDECIEGDDTSTDKDLQRTSCRSSLEPAISSPQLETANISIKDQDIPRQTKTNIEEVLSPDNETNPELCDDSASISLPPTPSPTPGTSCTPEPSQQPSKKTTRGVKNKFDEVLDIIGKRLCQPSHLTSVDKFYHIGKAWGSKLKDLDKQQAVHAEKIINDVFYEAQLGNLNRYCFLQVQQDHSSNIQTPFYSDHTYSRPSFNVQPPFSTLQSLNIQSACNIRPQFSTQQSLQIQTPSNSQPSFNNLPPFDTQQSRHTQPSPITQPSDIIQY